MKKRAVSIQFFFLLMAAILLTLVGCGNSLESEGFLHLNLTYTEEESAKTLVPKYNDINFWKVTILSANKVGENYEEMVGGKVWELTEAGSEWPTTIVSLPVGHYIIHVNAYNDRNGEGDPLSIASLKEPTGVTIERGKKTSYSLTVTPNGEENEKGGLYVSIGLKQNSSYTLTVTSAKLSSKTTIGKYSTGTNGGLEILDGPESGTSFVVKSTSSDNLDVGSYLLEISYTIVKENGTYDQIYQENVIVRSEQVSQYHLESSFEEDMVRLGSSVTFTPEYWYALNTSSSLIYILPNYGRLLQGNIEIPGVFQGISVTGVVDYSFKCCTSISSVSISEPIQTIGRDAFRGLSNLTSVFFPSTLREIKLNAFYGCSGIKKLVLPEGLRTIGQEAFRDCYSLETVSFPTTLETLETNAFIYCSSLKEVNLDCALTVIPSGAFQSCTRVTSVRLPSGLVSIEAKAFRNCTKISSLAFPSTLTTIGNEAFCGCTSLSSISLPSTLVSIGDIAFKDCKSLTTILYDGTVAQWNAIAKGSGWNTNVKLTGMVVCSDGSVSIR